MGHPSRRKHRQGGERTTATATQNPFGNDKQGWSFLERWGRYSVGMDGYERSQQIQADMLEIALSEARIGRAEGGIPVGAALFGGDGKLLASGRNRRVQQDDPSIHGETDAFRRAGRQRSYRETTMVTTLAPCWYCSGLIRQFGIGR